MKGIEYPVSLKALRKFEKENPTISITVFIPLETVIVRIGRIRCITQGLFY